MDSDDYALPAKITDTSPSNNDNPSPSPSAKTAASDSSSSSHSDSEEEALQQFEIQSLESHLSSDPSNYDFHVEYIRALRKLGELKKLRQAREAMSAMFPLSASLWQDWLKDEISLLSSSQLEAVSEIERLFDRAVFDYLSVPLWCDYLNFIQEHDSSVRERSVDGLSKARTLFERALTAAGLHFSEASKIWNAYLEFEQAIFHAIDESDTELKEKQLQRIRSIFHRQLSVPLAGMNSGLRAHKAWEVEQGNILDVDSDDLSSVSPNVASTYRKALKLYDARVDMEEHISRAGISESERLSSFMNYIRLEDSTGDPARVHVLYERAITAFPVSSDLWLDFTRYLDKTLKVGNVVRDVHLRATKSCPWVADLWVSYLLCLERCHSSEDEKSAIFEKALQCTFASYEEYVDLFLTRIDGLRRMMSVAEENQVFDFAIVRDTFQHASDYLSPQLIGTNTLLQLYTYWARLELSLCKDLAAARSVWESLLKIGGVQLEAWKGYIAMEIGNGNISEARSIYRRCYTKRFPESASEDICHSWLRFEREFGTLEDYEHAISKTSRRLEELELFRKQQELKTVTASMEQRDNSSKKKSGGKRKADPSLTDQHPVKRLKELKELPKEEEKMDVDLGLKPDQGNKEEMLVNSEPEGTDEHQKIKAKTEPEGTNEHQKMKTKTEPGGTNEHEKKESTRAKPKPRFTDQCTAFLSNLNLDTNDEHLRDFFSDVGGVVEIRILKDFATKKSRGLAYVDFSDEAHLTAALAKNRKTLMGKKPSIKRSEPNKGKKPESGKGGKRESSSEPGFNKDNSRAGKGFNSGVPALGGRKRGSESIQLEGKNTFAVPRAVRSVEKSSDTTIPAEDDETPKSNDEFRKLLLKK